MVDIKLSVQTAELMQQLDAAMRKITELKQLEATPVGQAKLDEFGAAGKELDSLLGTVKKLVDCMGQVDTKSKSYAKYLKESVNTLKEAEKIALKVANAHSVIRNASGQNAPAASIISEQVIRAKERADEIIEGKISTDENQKNLIKQQKEMAAQHASWARTAGKVASVAAGSLMGGGGMFANMGALTGLIPGIGPIAGPLLGGLGGIVDKTIDSNISKQLAYSELIHSIGGITANFKDLEGSITKVTSGLLLTNVQAVEVAKEFSKTAALTGDSNENIAKAVATAGGFAVGYNVDPKMTANFLGNMRLLGQTTDDKGDRQLAYKIGESVARSGTMTKMDDTLRALLGYVQTQTASNLMAADLGKFMDMFTGLTTSIYPGLNKNPDAASGMLQRADQGVRHFGVMGEASENAWIGAVMGAGMGDNGGQSNLSFIRHMREQGAFGNLQKAFGKGNAVYDEAVRNGNSKEVEGYDNWRETLKNKGITNMTQIGLSYAKQVGMGSTNLEMQNIAAMFGLNSEEEAAAFKKANEYQPAMDELAAHLKSKGLNQEDIDPEKLNSYFQISGGTIESHKKWFSNLKQVDGQLTPEQIAKGDEAVKSGDDEALKNMLYEAVDKGVSDPGRAAKQAEIDLKNKLNDAFEGMVAVVTRVNVALGKLADKLDWWVTPLWGDKHDQSGGTPSGGSQYNPSLGNESGLQGTIDKIRAAKTKDEKQKIADEYLRTHPKFDERQPKTSDYQGGLLDKVNQQKAGFKTWKELSDGSPDDLRKKIQSVVDESPATSQSDVPPSGTPSGTPSGIPAGVDSEIRRTGMLKQFLAPSKYDEFFKQVGKEQNLDWHLLKAMSVEESSLNPGIPSSKGAVGLMQIMPNERRMVGLTDETMTDPLSNIRGGAKIFNMKLDWARKHGYTGDAALRRAKVGYGGKGDEAELAADKWDAMLSYLPDESGEWGGNVDEFDRLPVIASNKKKERSKAQHISLSIDHVHRDANNNVLTNIKTPRTLINVPKPAGTY